MLSYWAWLAIFVFAPTLLLLAWKWKELVKYKKTILLCGIGSLAVAAPWDQFAIRNRLWWFPPEEILGIWLLGIPLEEWFFIFFIGIETGIAALVFMAHVDGTLRRPKALEGRPNRVRPHPRSVKKRA